MWFIFFFVDIDDYEVFVYVYLGGCQVDVWGVVYGLEYVVDQFLEGWCGDFGGVD